MSLDSSLPKQLLHLLEKRQNGGRRKQDRAKTTTVDASSGVKALPAGVERRKSIRRKAKRVKPRKM